MYNEGTDIFQLIRLALFLRLESMHLSQRNDVTVYILRGMSEKFLDDKFHYLFHYVQLNVPAIQHNVVKTYVQKLHFSTPCTVDCNNIFVRAPG